MKTGRAVVVLLAAALGAAGCGGDDDSGGSSSGSTRLVVSAASSLTNALEECGPRFGDQHNADVRLSFGGSDELAAQIDHGAPVDAYAAANTKLPDQLHADGKLGQPVDFATNEFVLGVPKGSDIHSLEDLTADGIKIAIGSESVPIGSYTREVLAKLPPAEEEGILANVRSNEPDVRGIVGKLVQGAADAGFVYITDVKASSGELEAIRLPGYLEPKGIYAAGVVANTKHRSVAERFVQGLTDGVCADSLKKAGFGPAP